MKGKRLSLGLLKAVLRRLFALMGYQVSRLQPAPSPPTIPAPAPRKEYLELDAVYNLLAAYEELLNLDLGTPALEWNSLRPRLLTRLLGTQLFEAYCILEALKSTRAIQGDVCEFGVAQGATSALIANEIAGDDRILYLFDSFEGLPPPSAKDELKDDIFALGSIEAYAGTMACPESMVLWRLKELSFPENRYRINKGFIENVIQQRESLPAQVSFAYVDFDFYEPIRIALQFLDTVTVQGSVIIVDDYDFFSAGAKSAVDEFIAEKNAAFFVYDVRICNNTLGHFATLTKRINNQLSLLTGYQGLIVTPMAT